MAFKVGNTRLFPDNQVIWVVSGRSVRGSKAWESLKSASASRKKLIFLVAFAYASRGGEGEVRAWLDVKHIASNQFCDLAGLGCIPYVELTYVWR